MEPSQKPDKKAKTDSCACGASLDKSRWDEAKQEMICQKCGAITTPQLTALSGADTEMLSVADMARIAQDGVDVSISGEWDTSGSKASKKPDRRRR